MAVEDINDLWGEEPDWIRKQASSNDDDDENDGDEEGDELAPAQHLVVLIDCAPAMFKELGPPPTDGCATQATTAMDWSLNAFSKLYREVMKTTVIHKAGKRNGLGAMLYNTRLRKPLVHTLKAKKEENDDEHYYADDHDDDEDDASKQVGAHAVHELIPLEVPNTPLLKQLMGALPDTDAHDRELDVKAEYGREDDYDNDDRKYVASFQIPVMLGIEDAKKVLDSAKCVRDKPVKKQGKFLMPPDSKQIWVLTNQSEDPCKDSPDVRAQVQERIRELNQAGVKVYVWQLPTADMMVAPEKRMNDDESHVKDDNNKDRLTCSLVLNPFFDDAGMLRPPHADEDDAPLDLYYFTQAAFKLSFQLRPSFSVPLLMPDWKQNPDYPGIQIDLYKIVKKATKPTAMRFHNETGELLARKTKITTEDELIEVAESITGHGYRQILPADRIKLFAPLRGGNENPLVVEMQPDDLVIMKKACNANPDFASLILTGFKPRNQVSFFDSIGEYYFMYPQDTKVEGSGKAFAQLFEGMQRKGVLAVGELLTRVSATSRCVAFWPIVNDESSELPPQVGMVMVYLPFEDEIRTLPEQKDYAVRISRNLTEQMDMDFDGPEAVGSRDKVISSNLPFVSDELVVAMKKLISQQSLDDRTLGQHFENAYLTEFYNYLESESLKKHWEPSSNYDTILTEEYEQALEAIGADIEDVKRLLPDDLVCSAAGKRKTTSVTADPDADDTGIDWDQEYEDGRIEKNTVPNLKKYCQAHGLPRTGNKGDVVKRVTDDLAKRQAARKIVKKETGLPWR